VTSESIRLHGRAIGHLGPARRRALGLRYVPDERLGHAAVPGLTLAENVLLTGDTLHAGGLIRLDRARALAARLLHRFDVRARGPAAPAESLSGGNLQKFIVGREIEAAPRVLLVNQPTWGVDVGAAARIRNELIALRAAGCGILVVSEELDELYALCDRLLVLAKGRMSPAVAPSAIGVDEVGRWMAGLWPGASPA
jgi:simple sugar transport system ATP-binding protein